MAYMLLLCIDGCAQVLQTRAQYLERLGYKVAIAFDADGALEVLENRVVSAVILDYRIHEMNPEAVALLVKQRFPEVPIILVSAHSEIPDSILWLVDEYVMNSEPLERLGDVIAKITHPSYEALAS